MKISERELREIVESSFHMTDCFERLQRSKSGIAFRHMRRKFEELGIDTNHFQSKRKVGAKSLLFNDIVNENDVRLPLTRQHKDMLRDHLNNVCSECGCATIWNNKPLKLQIDHIDGDNLNNKIGNLRLLCPNCHTQTDTYSGRKLRKVVADNYCMDCGKEVHRSSVRCRKCHAKLAHVGHQPKIDWPSNEELELLLKTTPRQRLGKILGVSDNAIKKHCIRNSIPFPTRNKVGPASDDLASPV